MPSPPLLFLALTLLLLIVLLPSQASPCGAACAEYDNQRTALVHKDRTFRFDANVTLTDAELKLASILASIRAAEISTQAPHGRSFLTENFSTLKPTIENSKLFPLLSTMPKGSILHSHAPGDPRLLFDLGTARDDCWVDRGSTSSSLFYFKYSDEAPANENGSDWVNVTQWRNSHSDPTAFNQMLFEETQFYTPANTVSQTDMWIYFDNQIGRIISLTANEEVIRAYLSATVHSMAAGGIYHYEQRHFFGGYHGSSYEDAIRMWMSVVDDYNKSAPPSKQFTIRFIYSAIRQISVTSMYEDLLQAVHMMNDPVLGKYVVGFDIVDEEDRFNTLRYYLDDWLKIQQYIDANNYKKMQYFFHAGETVINKGPQANLFDALLLNTTRIGHGYALKFFPLLEDIVREKGVAIEVCPISNQLLRLVDDFRNHPAASWITRGLPVTLSNDDPVIMGNDGLAYDFYVAYSGWELELKDLKQLSFNSLRFSALLPEEKVVAIRHWEVNWAEWVEQSLQTLSRS